LATRPWIDSGRFFAWRAGLSLCCVKNTFNKKPSQNDPLQFANNLAARLRGISHHQQVHDARECSGNKDSLINSVQFGGRFYFLSLWGK
jgi:hypothetical protein